MVTAFLPHALVHASLALPLSLSLSLTFHLLSAPGSQAGDVDAFSVAKGQHFTQLAVPGFDPMPDTQAFQWRAWLRTTDTNRLQSATVTSPDGTEHPLSLLGRLASATVSHASPAELDTQFPDGLYRFHITTANDGERSPALNLSSGNYPQAVRLLAPEALLDIPGRNDFTLAWEPFGAGTQPDAIQVRILGLTDTDVFRTPDPGRPGALAGSATQVVIPQDTWRKAFLPVGTPGLFQIQVTTFLAGTFDTSSLPGAIGYPATYRTTSIAALVENIEACGDVEHFQVLLGRVWQQSTQNLLEPLSSGGHVFSTSVGECLDQGISGARITPPGSPTSDLVPVSKGVFELNVARDSAAALATTHPAGPYSLQISTRSLGARSVTVTLRGTDLPPVRILNWDALQTPDYAGAIPIELAAEPSRTSADVLQLTVWSEDGIVVHQSAPWWKPMDRIPGTSTTLEIPRSTLIPGRIYDVGVRWFHPEQPNDASIPGASGFAGSFTETRFPIATRDPQVLSEAFGILTPAELPDLVLGDRANLTLEVRSALPPVQWTVMEGTLPTGLVLDSVSGDLLGIPSRPGPYRFTLQVTDASTHLATRTFTVQVAGQPKPLVLTSTNLSEGTGDLRYCGTLAASGGVAPLAWRLAPGSGPLPRGLQLDPEAGLVTGVPLESGTFPLRFSVQDQAGQSREIDLPLRIPPFTPPTPLRITGYQNLGHQHSLRLDGAESGSYLVESSTDLRSWNIVAASHEVPAGPWTFTDPPGPGPRFYRVRLGAIDPGTGSQEVHASPDPDPERSVEAVLSDSRNSLVLTNAQGIVFELSLPPGALRQPTPIRMTAVASIPDLPLSGGFLAAVLLEPEGLVLARPGTLAIRFPTGMPADATAFAAQERGADFHRMGHGSSSHEMLLRVPHFTLLGAGTEAQRNAAAQAGCSLEAWASDTLTLMAKLPNENDHETLLIVFSTWFDLDRGVRPALLRALANEQQIPNALREFRAWKELLDQTAADPRLKIAGADRIALEMTARFKAGRGLLGKAFLAAFNEIEARCRKNKSIRDAFRFRAQIALAHEAYADGLCDAVFDWTLLEKRLANLLVCEFAFRSTTLIKGDSAFSAARTKTRQRGILLWDASTDTWGGDSVARAGLPLDDWVYRDKAGTRTLTAANDRQGIQAQEVTIGWRAENRRTADPGGCIRTETVLTLGDIAFDFAARGDFDLTLVPKKGPPDNLEDDFWRLPLGVAFADQQTGTGFRMAEDWDWNASGERFARWSKSATRGTVTCSITIDLYYAP